ncbi:MAG: PRC-barrel domain-containing protein [Acidobacteriota bacterium]
MARTTGGKNMLRNITDLRGYTIRATDGDIGTVKDFYFDDEDWTVRYLVADTGGWLSGRQVLISPLSLGQPAFVDRLLPVALTKAQVMGSPEIDASKPVSRQHEAALFEYYGYPYYWGGAGMWGIGGFPGTLTPEGRIEGAMAARWTRPDPDDDVHLRSADVIIGNHIHGSDGDIGHVQDMLVDDHTWAIRYLIVNTSNWWLGHQVLLSPRWVDSVTWPERVVTVGMSRHAISHGPRYDSGAQFTRQEEQALYRHYDRPNYWTPRDEGRAVDRG